MNKVSVVAAINQYVDAAVMWMNRDNNSYEMATFSNGTWSDSQSLSEGAEYPQKHDLAMNDFGNIFAVWGWTGDSGTVEATWGTLY